jgi:hypothetical protein
MTDTPLRPPARPPQEGFPDQQQDQPGLTERDHDPKPDHGESSYVGSGRLEGRRRR